MTNSELRTLGLPIEARVAILSRKVQATAEEQLKSARTKGIRLLSLFDPGYPRLLREIYDPPPLLYCLGDTDLLETPAVALVGSRRCSVYGREVALKLARDIASLGLTLVSGLARGIDSQAHCGALQARGNTVAVMGNGVDVPYPRENRKLYRQICSEGCVISEFPCGTFPAPQNFPIRNRVISGLCYGTIIGEASEYSGSLITARLTLEQDRELWAVPGNVTNKGSYGPNYLIKQGAHLIVEAQDILEDLPLTVLDWLRQNGKPDNPTDTAGILPAEPLDRTERLILEQLSVEKATHIDHLQELLGLPQATMHECLLRLEMSGLVRQLPGRMFCKPLS